MINNLSLQRRDLEKKGHIETKMEIKFFLDVMQWCIDTGVRISVPKPITVMSWGRNVFVSNIC